MPDAAAAFALGWAVGIVLAWRLTRGRLAGRRGVGIAAAFVALIAAAAGVAALRGRLEHARFREVLAAAEARADALDPRWRWSEMDADEPPPPAGTGAAEWLGALRPEVVAAVREASGELARAERRAANRLLPAVAALSARRAARGLGSPEAVADALGRHPLRFVPFAPEPDFLSTASPNGEVLDRLLSVTDVVREAALTTGDGSAVWALAEAELAAGRALSSEQLFESLFIGARGRARASYGLERVLGMTSPSDAELVRIAGVLAKASRERPTWPRRERAGLHHLYTNLESNRLLRLRFLGHYQRHYGRTGSRKPPMRFADFAHYLIDLSDTLPGEHARMLLAFERVTAVAALPKTDRPAAGAALDAELFGPAAASDPRRTYLLNDLFLPIGIFFELDRRSAEFDRLTVLLLAAERHRLATGRMPASVGEVLPFLPPGEPPADYRFAEWSHAGGRLTLRLPFAPPEGRAAHTLTLYPPDQRRLPPESAP